MTINVYTIVYNNASFLELQYLSFSKHYPDIVFTIIDNAPDGVVRDAITQFAAAKNCQVIPVPNPRHDHAGSSHQVALHTAVQYIHGQSVIVDPDVFMLKPLDLSGDFVFAGLMQGTEKVRYIWPGFFVVNCDKISDKSLIDLRGALINPDNFDDFIIPDPAAGWSWNQYPEQMLTRISTDSGGLLCRYLRDYSPSIREFSLAFCEEPCYDSIIPEHLRGRYRDWFHYWVIGGAVLHSGVSSNWIGRPNAEFNEKSLLVADLVRWYLEL